MEQTTEGPINPEAFDEWIMEQELDEIPSYCLECGKVHGPEACQYEEE